METNKWKVLKESFKQMIPKRKPKAAAAPADENGVDKYHSKEWIKKTRTLEKELAKRKKERRVKTEKATHRRSKVKSHFDKAGFMVEHAALSKRLFNFTIVVNLAITAWMIFYFASREGYRLSTVLLSTVLIWFVLFFVILFILWLLFYLSLDLKIFKRKKSIEEVLPDFLELTSANINAGMTIDKAMWYAIRPRFGVLAKEVEAIAKQTMSGMDLPDALNTFAMKYNSTVLRRSINLLVEGIEAGGEIGTLLHKIAVNIKESQLLKKEMAASVTNYVIFISFSSIVAAPLLMALASNLLNVISSIIGQIDIPKSSAIPITLDAVGIRMADFQVFTYLSLGLTAVFSAIIVAIIKKGEIKNGIKYIPMFIIISYVLFTLLNKVFGLMLGSLI